MNAELKLLKIRLSLDRMGEAMKACAICPRKCFVDRSAGKLGFCRAPANPVVYSYFSHHGEEPAISATRGSGTIFFSFCNMKCVYCQNYHFSQLGKGQELSVEKLASIMLELQEEGCHNINLVTPTHFMPRILASLEIAYGKGLNLPIVYNTSGYELPEVLELLDGIVDIYLTDMRYSDNLMAAKYSQAPYYAEFNRASVIQMHRQTGNLILDKSGVAQKGLMIRLLALPANVSGIRDTLKFIKEKISPDAFLSIMSQYHPEYRASSYPDIAERITGQEYKNVVDEAHRLGLNNGWIQEIPAHMDTKFLGTNFSPRKKE